jgi:CheY-like chemotaxis protein
MARTVFVKVVGFRDAERHALNTVFRLSMERSTLYALWTPDAPVLPHVALIDVESYEAGVAIALPSLNRSLKLICVGEGAPEHAWRVFQRPINWSAVLHAMDQLFSAPEVDIPIHDAGDTEPTSLIPPGVRQVLLVAPSREERLYLRARLALAGLIEVDEATTVAEAQTKARERHYDLAIVDLDLPDEPWFLVDRLVALEPPISSVVVCTSQDAFDVQDRAEQAGCRAVIEKPYDPGLMSRVLQLV